MRYQENRDNKTRSFTRLDWYLIYKTHLPCHGCNKGSRTCCGYKSQGMASSTAGISCWCQWQSICHTDNKQSSNIQQFPTFYTSTSKLHVTVQICDGSLRLFSDYVMLKSMTCKGCDIPSDFRNSTNVQPQQQLPASEARSHTVWNVYLAVLHITRNTITIQKQLCSHNVSPMHDTKMVVLRFSLTSFVKPF